MSYSSEGYSSVPSNASPSVPQTHHSQGLPSNTSVPGQTATSNNTTPQPRPRRTNSVGRPRTVSDAYLQRLKELVSHDPREFGYPFRRWTARWLNQHLSQETGVTVSDRHINRLLKQMGLSTRTSYANSALSRRGNPDLHIKIADLRSDARLISS